jgi:anti-anti-sigma regulatory factor
VFRVSKISETDGSVTLNVEGRIVFEWVTTLEEECLQWLQTKKEVRVDCSGVTFIDRNGVAMLKRIASPNLKLINCPVLIAEILNGTDDQHED